MAYTAYQKCAQRGLTPGHDLAITGYDDWEQAEKMNPPLTTVVQNSYDMGWMAVIGAVELCRGGKIHNVVVPAQVKIRESCGCSREQRSLGGFTQEMSDDWKKAAGQYRGSFCGIRASGKCRGRPAKPHQRTASDASHGRFPQGRYGRLFKTPSSETVKQPDSEADFH